jgi:hypothetical protein
MDNLRINPSNLNWVMPAEGENIAVYPDSDFFVDIEQKTEIYSNPKKFKGVK